MCTNENENKQLGDEKFNQKYLTNSGVQLYFGNVFDQISKGKVPTIKHKLGKILVNYGMCQTYLEIDQKLNFIKVYYRDEQTMELKGLLLQRFNINKKNQAIELSISLEGSLVVPPSKSVKIRTYTGLTKFIYQEFISESKIYSLVDDNPYNQMKTIIKQGNLAACVPLESILIEGVD